MTDPARPPAASLRHVVDVKTLEMLVCPLTKTRLSLSADGTELISVAAHLAFPIKLAGDGALATVAQDSDADIVQSVQLLLRTRPGERRSIPDYGLPDPVFAGLTHDEVLDVVETWEERADTELLDIANLARSTGTSFGDGYFGDGYFGGEA